MEIKMPRGDSKLLGFYLREYDGGPLITEEFDEIYFTVKKRYNDSAVQFQKTLTEGGIVYNGDGHYTLTILPHDTENLPFGQYDFDLEFDRGDFVKTFFGSLTLDKETTHRFNKR